MINKLKTKCLTTLNNKNNDQQNEGVNNNVLITKDECQWIGRIDEYDEHSKICPFLLIICEHCNSFKIQRKLLSNHIEKCPKIKIECNQLCGMNIIRKNLSYHLDKECGESILKCSNNECKEEIERKYLSNHLNDECLFRLIDCPYLSSGCDVKQIKFINLNKHLNEYKIKHIKMNDMKINKVKTSNHNNKLPS